MKLEIWNELKYQNFLIKLFPLGNVWAHPIYSRAVNFIQKLLDNGIKLDQININDFLSNTKPSVYVGTKRYSRLAKNDYLLVLRHYKIKTYE